MGELRAQFGDTTQTQCAEAEVRNIRIGSKPVAEYIREFRGITGRLRHWPEQLLTHYFKDDLNCELYHTDLTRGIPNQLNN